MVAMPRLCTTLLVLAFAAVINAFALSPGVASPRLVKPTFFSARPLSPVVPSLRGAHSRMQAEAAAADDGDSKRGPLAKLASALPPRKELKKVLPLGLMFFFILFNYTILRDVSNTGF